MRTEASGIIAFSFEVGYFLQAWQNSIGMAGAVSKTVPIHCT